MSFVLNFTVIDNYPRGCGPLDGEWRKDQKAPYIKGGFTKKGKERKVKTFKRLRVSFL